MDKKQLELLFKINPNNLKTQQFHALKEFAVERLRLMADLIEDNNFDEATKYIEYSPSGDDMGCTNYFINFSFIEDEYTDISDVIYSLKELNPDKEEFNLDDIPF